MLMEDGLGCKCQLGNDILLCLEIAIEGIVLGGDVDTVVPSNAEPIVFHVQTVGLQRISVNSVIRAIVMTLDYKSPLGIVSKTGLSEILNLPQHYRCCT